MEQNKIYDRELKENLANYAISILLENNLITKDDFSSVTFEFGYLFQTDTDEIEALYSMMIADKFFPFACQKGKIMYLTISKEQYDETVENMKSIDIPIVLRFPKRAPTMPQHTKDTTMAKPRAI